MKREVGAAVLALALASCGGGGSSAPSIGGGGSAAFPTPAPSVTTVQGTLVDCNWSDALMSCQAGGAPIAGATIALSTTLIGGTTAPSGAVVATTNGSGQFSLSYPSASLQSIYFYAFPTDGHASIHAQFGSSTGWSASSTTGIIAQSVMPSANDNAWLAQINANLAIASAYPATISGYTAASAGVKSTGAPLTFDSYLLMAARSIADYDATNGVYAHCITSPQGTGDDCPGQDEAEPLVSTWIASPASRAAHFGAFTGPSENLDGAPSSTPTIPGLSYIGAQLDDMFFYEATGYTPSGQYVENGAGGAQNCTYVNCGHYINIISATKWVGVGDAVTQKTGPGVSVIGGVIGLEDYI